MITVNDLERSVKLLNHPDSNRPNKGVFELRMVSSSKYMLYLIYNERVIWYSKIYTRKEMDLFITGLSEGLQMK